jgi:hypothetical protein
VSWSRAFDDPIPLPSARALVTLQDAARYIQKLPSAEQNLEHWQTAVQALLLVVKQNGPTMLARIAMMQALNHGRSPPEKPARRKRAKAYRIIGIKP